LNLFAKDEQKSDKCPTLIQLLSMATLTSWQPESLITSILFLTRAEPAILKTGSHTTPLSKKLWALKDPETAHLKVLSGEDDQRHIRKNRLCLGIHHCFQEQKYLHKRT
jgi:hypothetical protein